ncbi:MAG TPA: hypothetical protein HPP80_07920 [Rhodospirillaceae bacterium]|nr:hypothetical protein [Rhodospirillaceae bacterium]
MNADRQSHAQGLQVAIRVDKRVPLRRRTVDAGANRRRPMETDISMGPTNPMDSSQIHQNFTVTPAL